MHSRRVHRNPTFPGTTQAFPTLRAAVVWILSLHCSHSFLQTPWGVNVPTNHSELYLG